MLTDDEWNLIRALKTAGYGGSGSPVLRAALLFGGLAVLAALLLAPFAENQMGRLLASAPDVDPVMTGSVATQRATTYTIRRSILQASPDAVCIISSNGVRSGDCATP